MLKASSQEIQRLARTKIVPDVRFHYRVIAAALAMKAADLLPENSDGLADVINTAGQWVKDRDEKVARKYFNLLEQRCGRTKIGRAAIAKHWFVGESGAWSSRQEQDYEAMHQELGLPKVE